MFEGQPQAEVEALMTHPEFKQLYQRHKQLDIRAVVSPVPYASVVRETYAAGWRSVKT